MNNLDFGSICADIDAKCTDLGLPWSWRFLYTPQRTLEKNNGLLILGLNPGGTATTPVPSVEEGNAYYVEKWKSPLQKKFVALMQEIYGSDWVKVMNESVTSNLIPFVAPQITKLNPWWDAIEEYVSELWCDMLVELRPTHVIAIGSTVGKALTDIFDNQSWSGDLESFTFYKHGLQRVDIRNYRNTKIVTVPHLAHWNGHCDHPSLVDPVTRALMTL